MKREKKVEKVGEEIKVYEIDALLDSIDNLIEIKRSIRILWEQLLGIDVIWLKK